MSRAQQIQQVIQSSNAARAAGSPEDALPIIEAALVDFPKSRQLWLRAAKDLHKIGDRFDQELESWHNCFDVFEEKAQLKWFKTCRKSILRRYRHSTDQDLIETKKRLIGDLHAKARKYLIDTAIAHEHNARRRQIAHDTSVWISEWQASEQDTAEAFAAHFSEFPDTKTGSTYLQYARLLFEDVSEAGKSKFKDLQNLLEKNFPLGSDPSLPAQKGQAKTSGNLWLKVALGLMEDGQVELAQNILGRIPEGIDGLQDALNMAENLKTHLAVTIQEGSSAPSLGVLGEKSIVIWSPEEPSDKVIFVFTGAAGKFAFSLSFFHQLLEKFACHIVYLKDNDNQLFVRGGVWNNPEDLEKQLIAIKNKLGATQSYALGSSSGGYAALRFGIALKVDGILSFDIPVVSPSDALLPGSQMMFQNVQRKFPKEEFDLVKYCATAPEIPSTTITFSEGCTRDRAAARKLADFPQISLVMAKGANSHGSIKTFVTQGSFFPMIERMISG